MENEAIQSRVRPVFMTFVVEIVSMFAYLPGYLPENWIEISCLPLMLLVKPDL